MKVEKIMPLWTSQNYFGWIHNKGTPGQFIELSKYSAVKLIRENIKRCKEQKI